MENEIWVSVPSRLYQHLYSVSNQGRLRSDKTGKILSPGKNSKGYLTITMFVSIIRGKPVRTNFTVHRLVATCFVPNPNNLPEVNHLDGDKLNNNDWNLEWSTSQNNTLHAIKMGLRNPPKGKDHWRIKKKLKETLVS